MTRKHIPRHWSFVRGIHRSPLNSLHKGPVTRGFCVFFDVSLNSVLKNSQVGSHDAYLTSLLWPSYLTHWGRARHICVSKLTIIGSDNGLSPGRRQAIIWTIAGILLIGSLRNKLQWNINRSLCISISGYCFWKCPLLISQRLFRYWFYRSGDKPIPESGVTNPYRIIYGTWGRFKNTYELLNLRALKISHL